MPHYRSDPTRFIIILIQQSPGSNCSAIRSLIVPRYSNLLLPFFLVFFPWCIYHLKKMKLMVLLLLGTTCGTERASWLNSILILSKERRAIDDSEHWTKACLSRYYDECRGWWVIAPLSVTPPPSLTLGNVPRAVKPEPSRAQRGCVKKLLQSSVNSSLQFAVSSWRSPEVSWGRK